MWRCVALWAAVGLGLAAGPAAAQKQGGILRAEHIDNPPSASSPLEEVTASVLVPFMSLYNNLVMFDPLVEQNSAASIAPDLAARWSPSDDGKSLTFKLHSGVKWHDGKPFSAKDVQCTWDLLLGRAEHKLRRIRATWWENVELGQCGRRARSDLSPEAAAAVAAGSARGRLERTLFDRQSMESDWRSAASWYGRSTANCRRTSRARLSSRAYRPIAGSRA